jgi:hypothetical protein
MTEPGLAAIRAAAPGWARFLGFTGTNWWWNEHASTVPGIWQSGDGNGPEDRNRFELAHQLPVDEWVDYCAVIDLSTWTVRIQELDGPVMEATRKEWDV